MDRVNYLFYQLFLKIKYEKRRYFLYVLSFYVGLLLPTCCIANTRSVEQVIYYTTFKGMEDSFQVDWLSRTFNTIKLDKEISYSISAFYEESFPEWENQYVSIKGIDESYFYPLPKIEGRTFSKKELQEGKDVCLMNKQYARMHACEIGDMIQIRDKRLKVIGLIDNSVYSGMIIPYQTMLNVYKEEKDIQFSGTFFCENELQKQKRIDEVIEQIKEKDNHADILGVTEGEELYKNALYTKIQWRIVRGMCALVAILFFMINETIVLMAKAKKERKIMGINLALGATERDIKYCLFFETLLVTLLAVFLVMITLRPLAKLASLEHIIILDSMVIVETVCLLSRKKVDGYVNVDLDTDKIVSKSKTGTATYKEIKEYINDKYGFTVSSLNIAQIKDKCGLDKRKNYNKGAEGHKVPACPEKKEKAILDAFEHLGLV